MRPTTEQARAMNRARKKRGGGRPRGITMPCGWGCGGSFTTREIRTHFSRCPNRPKRSDALLGACCNCGIENYTVRNVIMLSQRSPEPGIGCWGCLTCDLEQAGAVAVLCDSCLKALEASHAHPKTACLGSPADNRRIPVEQLDPAVFDHDLSLHVDEEDREI